MSNYFINNRYFFVISKRDEDELFVNDYLYRSILFTRECSSVWGFENNNIDQLKNMSQEYYQDLIMEELENE